jgi:hypothetical protein
MKSRVYEGLSALKTALEEIAEGEECARPDSNWRPSA